MLKAKNHEATKEATLEYLTKREREREREKVLNSPSLMKYICPVQGERT